MGRGAGECRGLDGHAHAAGLGMCSCRYSQHVLMQVQSASTATQQRLPSRSCLEVRIAGHQEEQPRQGGSCRKLRRHEGGRAGPQDAVKNA